MGGRGTVSGGRGNTGAGVSAGNVSALSDSALSTLDDSFKLQIRIADKRLQELSANNPAYNMPQEYYDIQRDKQSLQAQHRTVINEISSRKRANSAQIVPKSRNTFVNSFGEATTREITTATYKRAQKALEKQIANLMR